MSSLPYTCALVTGASSGIGAELARQLCGQGVKVLAVARSADKLKQVKQSVPAAQRDKFVPVSADLTTTAGIQAMVQAAKRAGGVDLLVNNAGAARSGKFEELTDDDIERMIRTNLVGSLQLTRNILGLRKPGQPLQIVFVTSLAGKIGFGDLSVYSATKFGLEGFCEALKMEYADTPEVTISVFRPGITDTGFFEQAGMQDFKESVKDTKAFYPASKVARAFMEAMPARPRSVTVGNDKYYLMVLPFTPFRWRFKVLDLFNKW